MKKEFGLYIHWPFCLKKCPYCDFNSYTFAHDPNKWTQMLIKEIKNSNIFENGDLKTIFFGGGTPSLMPPESVGLIISTAKSIWRHEPDIEITLETNPSSLEAGDLEKFMKNGINRFSIGVQSLKNEDLKFLGRLHSSQEAIEILKAASNICENVSADFIYALPQQNLIAWQSELEQIFYLAETLNLKHLSLYQLTIEEKTAFAQSVKSGKWKPMKDDLQADLYEHTYRTIEKMNWNFYEISNVSRETFYESQHNMGYWQYKPYLGIGPGAHSRCILKGERIRFYSTKNPYKWMEKIETSQNVDFLETKEEVERLSEEDTFKERILMGMRLNKGVTISQYEEKFINPLAMENLINEKMIIQNGENYKLTLDGRLKLNSILSFILK